jgi:hypothetical protein
MNERIGELYTQALEYADSKVPPALRYNDIYYAIVSVKHAELIVKECIELNRQELAFNAFERMLNRYKEHFGVEE